MSEFILFPDVNSSLLSERHIITRYCIQMLQSASRRPKRVSLSLKKQLNGWLVY